MPDIVPEPQQRDARHLVEMLAAYKKAEDLINLGAYKAGASPGIDRAIRMRDPILRFLRQDVEERVSLPESVAALSALIKTALAEGEKAA
jgi:flagellum-specific ATP synthase